MYSLRVGRDFYQSYGGSTLIGTFVATAFASASTSVCPSGFSLFGQDFSGESRCEPSGVYRRGQVQFLCASDPSRVGLTQVFEPSTCYFLAYLSVDCSLNTRYPGTLCAWSGPASATRTPAVSPSRSATPPPAAVDAASTQPRTGGASYVLVGLLPAAAAVVVLVLALVLRRRVRIRNFQRMSLFPTIWPTVVTVNVGSVAAVAARSADAGGGGGSDGSGGGSMIRTQHPAAFIAPPPGIAGTVSGTVLLPASQVALQLRTPAVTGSTSAAHGGSASSMGQTQGPSYATGTPVTWGVSSSAGFF